MRVAAVPAASASRLTAVTDRWDITQYGRLSGLLGAPVTIAGAPSPAHWRTGALAHWRTGALASGAALATEIGYRSCSRCSPVSQWFAEQEPDGLLFVGEKGAPFRRSTFVCKWRKARTKVGMPPNFRFYDLRHTGNTLAADTGAKLKDLMVRAGQSAERVQLIYQHSTAKHQRRLAQGIDAEVRAQLREAAATQQSACEA